MSRNQGASLRDQAGHASHRAEVFPSSRPFGDHPSRGTRVLRLVEERPTQRGDGGPKIRVFINDQHVALILRVKRELCVGEEVRAA